MSALEMMRNEAIPKMCVTVLPPRLKIIYIKQEHIQFVTFALLKVILYSDSTTFYSATRDEDGISLVLQEEFVEEFPVDYVTIYPYVFRAFEVSISFSYAGYTSTGVINALTAPLAADSIPIYHISCYSTDYILVRELHMNTALNSVDRLFEVTIFGLDNEQEQEILNLSTNDTPLEKNLTFLSEDPYFICAIERDCILDTGSYLIQSFLFTKKSMMSITQTEEEVSVVLNSTEYDKFPSSLISPSGQPWTRFYYTHKSEVDQATKVQTIASPLAKASIGIFYLTAVNTDHILVRSDDLNAVKKALEGDWELTA